MQQNGDSMSSISTLFGSGLGSMLINNLSLTGKTFWIVIAVALVLDAIIAYLLGSINFAVMISDGVYKDDVRSHGSKNAGTTNMLRTYGKKAAALTFVGDGVKAAISVLVGMLLMGRLGGYIAGFFCIIGHMYPIYYKFKGGKGVVTTAVMILMLDWRVFLILLVLFVGLVAATKYISLGSIICVMVYPIALFRIDVITAEVAVNNGSVALENAAGLVPSYDVIIAFLVMLLVVYKHRENIARLLHGEESKVSFKKKTETAQEKKKENNE
jgi:glycerol-3-phosphate acyltransferase PlsY